MNEQEFRKKYGERIFQIETTAWELLGTSADKVKSEDWFKAIDYLITEVTKVFDTNIVINQNSSQATYKYKHVRTLPEQKPRVETGMLKFENDWTGLFLRGDDCTKFYCDLIAIKEIDELDATTKVKIEYWMKLLNSACETIVEWQVNCDENKNN
jgi:hypothetical protein